MLNAEHLIENAVCALEKYEVQEAYRQFMESPCNIELAESAGIRLDDVWVMAVYCTTTLRQDWKEKWEDSLKRWIPVTERLPEEEGDYLCLENGDVRIIFFDKFEQAFGYDRTVVDPEILGWLESEFIPYNVTHWMPLPESPKEVHNEP